MPQLADLIRKKYPDAYKDMSDDDLEKAIVAKYPQYKTLATPPTPDLAPPVVDNAPPAEAPPINNAPPPTTTTTTTTPNQPPQQGWLSKLWHGVSDPLTDAPSRFANSVADYITTPHLDDSHPMIKGAIAGGLKGVGDLVSGATSPLNLATMALTGGASLTDEAFPAVSNLMNIGARITGAPVTAHGISQVMDPSLPVTQRAMGLSEIAGGLAAMHGPSETPTLPQEQLPTGKGISPSEMPMDRPDLVPQGNEAGFNGQFTKQVLGNTDENLFNKASDKFNMGRPLPNKPTAEFLGLNEDGSPLFNIKGGDRDGSTVSSATLDKLGIEAPEVPDDAKPMRGDELRQIALKNRQNAMDSKNTGFKGTVDDNSANDSSTTPDNSTAKLPIGTKVVIKSNKATPEMVKKAMAQGFEFDRVNDEGHFIFEKTSDASNAPKQPILESEVGHDRLKLGPSTDIKKSNPLAEAMNFPRAVMASTDMSAPLRQGIGLIHKPEFWKAIPEMFKAWGSEDAFNQIQQSIAEKPLFKPRAGPNGTILPSFAEDAGLKLTDLTSLSNREEQLMSSWAEKVPGFGHVYRASERSYTAFLNKLRADTFESLINQGKVIGADGTTNAPLAKSLADFVNTATGRGSLGKLENSAVALNSTFFAPRLIASRLKMLNPAYYYMANPMVRKEALKSLFAIAGTGNMVGQLAKMAGAQVSGDPTSSDFGKIKIGNTVRIDPFAGFQQYIVAASKLMSGKTTSTTTGQSYNLGEKFGRPTRFDVADRFVESKLNPMLAFATSMLHGKDVSGQPFNVPEEIAQRFIPLFLQDLKSVLTDDPNLIPGIHKKNPYQNLHPENAPLAVPAWFGMGLQNYGTPRP